MTKEDAHIHRWLLASPSPGFLCVRGVCACGAAREFPAFHAPDYNEVKSYYKQRAKEAAAQARLAAKEAP